MVELAVAAFLVAHGLIHLTIYVPPKNPAQRKPYDPVYSWALDAIGVGPGPMHATGTSLAVLVAALFVVAGIVVPFSGPAAAGIALVAAGTALVLKGLWFSVWLVVGIALDLAVVVAVSVGWPQSLF